MTRLQGGTRRRIVVYAVVLVLVLAFMSVPAHAAVADDDGYKDDPNDGAGDEAKEMVDDAPTDAADKKVKKSAVDSPDSVDELVTDAEGIAQFDDL